MIFYCKHFFLYSFALKDMPKKKTFKEYDFSDDESVSVKRPRKRSASDNHTHKFSVAKKKRKTHTLQLHVPGDPAFAPHAGPCETTPIDWVGTTCRCLRCEILRLHQRIAQASHVALFDLDNLGHQASCLPQDQSLPAGLLPWGFSGPACVVKGKNMWTTPCGPVDQAADFVMVQLISALLTRRQPPAVFVITGDKGLLTQAGEKGATPMSVSDHAVSSLRNVWQDILAQCLNNKRAISRDGPT